MLNGEAGETYAVRLEKEQVLLYSENGELLGLANGTVRIVGDAEHGEILLDGARYPGSLDVRRSPKGGLNVVNVLDVETYLRGVVPLEIGHAGDYLEAAKAQAVAARTYTAGHMGQYPDEGFDLEAGVQDQVYGSIDRRHPDADRAVEETRGLLLVHDGIPIRANYSSTCGGKSASLEESFGAQGVPYLEEPPRRSGWKDCLPDIEVFPMGGELDGRAVDRDPRPHCPRRHRQALGWQEAQGHRGRGAWGQRTRGAPAHQNGQGDLRRGQGSHSPGASRPRREGRSGAMRSNSSSRCRTAR